MLIVLVGWAGVALLVVSLVISMIESRAGSAGAAGRLLAWPGTPVILAMLFALLSLPMVALTLNAVDTTDDFWFARESKAASELGRWSAAGGAALLSSIVAAALGAPAVRRNARPGGMFTFVIALLVAIPAFPLLPMILGQNVGAGVLCIDQCQALVSTNSLWGGLLADLLFWLSPVVEPIPVVTLAVGVGLWTWIVRRLSELTSAGRPSADRR